MLSKRIIPCLDVKDGRTVKGINFVNLRDAGDPVELAYEYCQNGADELVFLDISATIEGRSTTLDLVKDVARQINIPFTIGGGITTLKDAENLLNSGADKVSINSAAVHNPNLIDQLAREFGSQFVIVAIDTKLGLDDQGDHHNFVFLNGGMSQTTKKVADWVLEVEQRGAGEILLTSMDFDGTKMGFDIELLKEINQKLRIPLIASGGAGKIEDFVEVFRKTNVDAALAASVFHDEEIKIPVLKAELALQGLPIRL